MISYCLPQSGIHTGFQCVVPSSQPTMFYFAGARIALEKPAGSIKKKKKQLLLHASIHFSKRTILKQDEVDTGVVQEKCSSGLLNLPVCRAGFPFTSCCRCRCAALPPTPEPDSLQRAPGQPAVSAKRDQNNLLCFVINIGAGEGEALRGCRCGLCQRLLPGSRIS